MSSSIADPKSVVEEGYDKIAPTYLAWAGPRPTVTRAEYLERVLSLIPAGGKILELGCGAGVPCTQLMSDRGFDVTASDISTSQIELAKQHVQKATFIRSDMVSLDLPENSFDAVVAFYSIFHLPVEEHGEIVKKIASWLKPGGYTLFNLGVGPEHVWDDWMGVKMFSTSLGAEGNREIMKQEPRLEIVVDDLAIEKVGGMEETFHWFLATKKAPE